MNWTHYSWERIDGIEQVEDWCLLSSTRAMDYILGHLLKPNEAVVLKADNGWTARVYRTFAGNRYVKVFRPDGTLRGQRRFP